MLLRAFAFDRSARIRAVQAVFTSMSVDHFDEIKKLVWKYLDQPPLWQFLADAGWSNCDSLTQEALTDAEQQGRSTILMHRNVWHYEYSLERMTQTNLSTAKVRGLRRCSPWAVKLLPRWQYQTRCGWTDCDIEMQHVLCKAVLQAEADQQVIVQRELRGTLYEFDFVELTQTNTLTGRVRALYYGAPCRAENALRLTCIVFVVYIIL